MTEEATARRRLRPAGYKTSLNGEGLQTPAIEDDCPSVATGGCASHRVAVHAQ